MNDQKCADDFAADYWGESRQRASASCCGAEGAATPPHAFPPENLPAESHGSAGPFLWTEAETEKLRHDGSASASQTALALSDAFHRTISRGAVIGKCHREGIVLSWTRRVWHPAEPTPNPFPDLTGCLWGHGHPGSPGFRFCGAPRTLGKPYCAAHAAVCYVPDKLKVPA